MEDYNDFNETQKVTINPAKMNSDNFDFVGRNVVAHFENNPKRYKIRARKAFEQEIDEERKRVTMNTFVVGGTVLVTAACALITGNEDLEIAQRMGALLMGVVSSKGVYESAKILSESLKRKVKLEDTYFEKFGQEYEEKRGRSLW